MGAALDNNKTLQRQIDEQRTQFEAEKRELEFALADVNNAESSVAAIQASAQDDFRRQVQLTQVREHHLPTSARVFTSQLVFRRPTRNTNASSWRTRRQ